VIVHNSRNRFYFNHVGIPLILALVLFVSVDLTGLDVRFSDWIYNTSTHAFPLQHSKLFETITHKWARIIPNWTGEAAIIGALLSFLWPRFRAEKHARMMAWLEKVLHHDRRDPLFQKPHQHLLPGGNHVVWRDRAAERVVRELQPAARCR
jgi:membrane-associated PAP2 superfamily phosphatase